MTADAIHPTTLAAFQADPGAAAAGAAAVSQIAQGPGVSRQRAVALIQSLPSPAVQQHIQVASRCRGRSGRRPGTSRRPTRST